MRRTNTYYTTGRLSGRDFFNLVSAVAEVAGTSSEQSTTSRFASLAGMYDELHSAGHFSEASPSSGHTDGFDLDEDNVEGTFGGGSQDGSDSADADVSSVPEAPNFYQRYVRGRVQDLFEGLGNLFSRLIDPIINFGFKDFFLDMFNATCNFLQSMGSKMMNAVSSLGSLFRDLGSSAQSFASDCKNCAAKAESFSRFFSRNTEEPAPGAQSPQTPAHDASSSSGNGNRPS